LEQVMASRRYTLADVVAAVAASTSIRQVLDRLDCDISRAEPEEGAHSWGAEPR
jgi:hypothetical protein